MKISYRCRSFEWAFTWENLGETPKQLQWVNVFQRFQCAVTEEQDQRLKIVTQPRLLLLLVCAEVEDDLHFYKVTQVLQSSNRKLKCQWEHREFLWYLYIDFCKEMFLNILSSLRRQKVADDKDFWGLLQQGKMNWLVEVAIKP